MLTTHCDVALSYTSSFTHVRRYTLNGAPGTTNATSSSGIDWPAVTSCYDAANDSSAASTRSTIMGGSPRTLAEGGGAPPPPPPPPSHMQQQQQHLQLMSNPLDGYCTWDRGAGGVAGGEGDYQVGWQLGVIVKKHLRTHTDARFVSPQKKVLFYGLFYRRLILHVVNGRREKALMS